MSKYSIIYIAGYGRSGSTLLDVILGNTEHSHSCGELNTIFDEYLNGEKCSCGKTYDNCPTWAKLFEQNINIEKVKLYQKVIRSIDKRETVFNPWNKNTSNEEKHLYNEVNNFLFETISDENTKFLVDSSKTAADGSFRPIALKEWGNLDVKIVHIQRNLFDVLKSLKKGSNRAMQNKKDIRLSLSSQVGLTKKSNYVSGSKVSFMNILRGSIGYYLANRDAKKLQNRLGDDNYIKIYFEDLLKTPEKVLGTIEQKFDLDLTASKNKIISKSPFVAGHTVGGNRMVQNKNIIFGAQ